MEKGYLRNILMHFIIVMLCILFTHDAFSQASEQHDGVTGQNKILLIYYSRTGKTETIAKAIARATDADVIRITEPHKDRSGWEGFLGAAIDAFFDRRSDIEPRKIDLSPYDTVIIATPIWSWNLATPIHTLLRTNYFGKKRLILVTTANIDIKKYDKYKDGSGTAVQRFLHQYLEEKRMKARREIIAATANDIEWFKGHFHVETKGKLDDVLDNEGMALGAKIASLLELRE
ncbi:MAG: hypothetical protein N3B18_11610 [Desulfobacterota bacterium]|nr:hypothetical protein [Thermodesulfobacteriota bacterium]